MKKVTSIYAIIEEFPNEEREGISSVLLPGGPGFPLPAVFSNVLHEKAKDRMKTIEAALLSQGRRVKIKEFILRLE